MSRSPRTTSDPQSLAEYRDGWQATMQLLRAGKSFSGHERNCVFLNEQGQHFANGSALTGLDFADDGRAIGVTDWDQDGDLDLWLRNRTGPRLRLMRNETVGLNRPDPQSFVSFQLQGTQSNRDAIGARVMLEAQTQNGAPALPRVQSLYAGDTYLSQSTKWLHFGLGHDRDVIKGVTVRWPNGQYERFAGVEAGHRYRLIEGSGRAEPIAIVATQSILSPQPQPVINETGTSRTLLANRIPLPLLKYSDLHSKTTRRIDATGRPQLIVFWASWCLPCIEELRALVAQREYFADGHIDVLAVSLDGLDGEHATSVADAERLLAELRWPWSAGQVSLEFLEKWEFTTSVIFNRRLATGLPSSLLLDEQGDIAIIYRGGVTTEQLERDVLQLPVPATARRDLAVPLPGRWLNPPRTLLLRALAQQYEKAGYHDDFTNLLSREARQLQAQDLGKLSQEQRTALLRRTASANFDLALALVSTGDYAEAAQYFRETIKVQPEHVEALSNLGSLLARAKQWPQAIPLLNRAVDLAPDDDSVRSRLAAALSSAGDFRSSANHYQRLVERDPENAEYQARLGRAWAELNLAEQAKQAFETALRLAPDDDRSQLSLGWLLATNANESVRDGRRAAEIARRRCDHLPDDPVSWDLLAAAQAEQGDMEGARQSVRRALDVLSGAQAGLRRVIAVRQAGYANDRAFRDDNSTYP